jgi:hypothetical protein
MRPEMLTIGQGHDTVDTEIVTNLRIRLDGVDNGCGVGKASRFKEDGIKIFSARGKLAKGTDEITANRTANAAVVHGDDILGGIKGFGDWLKERYGGIVEINPRFLHPTYLIRTNARDVT